MPAPRQGSGLVEHLNAKANTKLVNHDILLGHYFRSAEMLVTQAAAYRAEGNEEQLYVMLMRYASLVIETIPKHRDFGSKKDARYARLSQLLLQSFLPELERLKTSLRLRDIQHPTAKSINRPREAVQISTSALPQLDWGPTAAVAPTSTPIYTAPGLIDDLLDVMQGHTGATPPLADTSATSFSHQQQQQQQQEQYAHRVYDQPSVAPALIVESKYASSSQELSSKHALFGYGSSSGSASASASNLQRQASTSFPRYPQLQQSSSMGRAGIASLQQQQQQLPPGMDPFALPAQQSMGNPSAGPTLGPQEMQVLNMASHDHPGIPSTCTTSTAVVSAQPMSEGGPRELKKMAQLRDVHVSLGLMDEFLRYAASNTAKGIESCGILAGRLQAGDSIFSVCSLIIPKQTGTTDTVQALNEEEIFDVQFKSELYPLGWIHTHPTQTCFLSSIDVHTQCGYQTMLDEAIAIVMAPTDRTKRWGIFRLTTPGGLGLVQKCNMRGFHQHPPTDTGQEVYDLCGHVFLNPRVEHEVIDLR